MDKTARRIVLPYPKDENGKPLCRWCRGPVSPPRQCWCSDKCVQEYRDRYDASHQRRQVKKRDKGVCAVCGLDTTAFKAELRETYFLAMRERGLQGSEHYIHHSLEGHNR